MDTHGKKKFQRKIRRVKVQDLVLQSLGKPESKPIIYVREKSQDM